MAENAQHLYRKWNITKQYLHKNTSIKKGPIGGGGGWINL